MDVVCQTLNVSTNQISFTKKNALPISNIEKHQEDSPFNKDLQKITALIEQLDARLSKLEANKK